MNIFGKRDKKYVIISSLEKTKDAIAFACRHGGERSDMEVRASGTLFNCGEDEPLVTIEFKSKESKDSIFESFLKEIEGSRARKVLMFC